MWRNSTHSPGVARVVPHLLHLVHDLMREHREGGRSHMGERESQCSSVRFVPMYPHMQYSAPGLAQGLLFVTW